ncbi:related to F-box/WD40 repeat protein 7 [Ustilago sp. UG-2017b]|nr:related to F-box/WD40 repeat protein 7 [Ustilago sp. UG-2017b]
MSISPHHRAISPPTPAPSPQPDLHTSIRLANNAASAAAAASVGTPSAPHPLIVDPNDPSQLLKHLSLVLPQYSQSARFELVSELADLFSVRELAHLSSVITPRLKVDFLSALPIEVSLSILSFIDDPKTLARASCVSRFWRSLVNDEHTWKVMCLKHKYRRRGSSNATIHPLDDRLARSISTLAIPRIRPSSSNSSSLGVLLQQPLRPIASSQDADADVDVDVDADAALVEQYTDQDDAAVLASLYQRYRDHGLDPSNALHELRTLHDLYLTKRQGAHGNLNQSMSEADLAFYAQLEEIVEEESRARYGDEAASVDEEALDTLASPTASSRPLATIPHQSSPAASNLGWLSAGPCTATASATASATTAATPSQPTRMQAPTLPPAPAPASINLGHAVSAPFRTATGRLDRLQGWQQSTPSAAIAAFATPRIHDAETSVQVNNPDEAMDMDDGHHLASTLASSSAGPAGTGPIGQPPNAPLLASLPRHHSPTGRFSASVASPSTGTHAATRRSAGSSALVPGPRDSRQSQTGRSPSGTLRTRSASIDEHDSANTGAPATGLHLFDSSAPSRSSVQERSSQAGPSRHSTVSPSAVHAHRHRSAKVPFSYRTHFKMAYLTESNWRKGGRLQTQHVSADAGHVVTSLAIDSEWIVVGMANSKIHVFSAETGLYAHTLLGHDAGVWCLTLISKSNSSKHGQASTSQRGKGKMVITDPEDGSGGKPYQATADGDLRLVHHDPRPDAADALLSPPPSSIEVPEEADVFGGRRLPSSTASTPSGKARQTSYGHGETLEWFHKARRALRRQQSARRAAAAAGDAADGSRSRPLVLDDNASGAGDSDADLSIRSEGASHVHRELRSSTRARTERDELDREAAKAIAEAEAGAIRDAVMADGTGQVPAQLAERIRRDGELAAAGAAATESRANRTRAASSFSSSSSSSSSSYSSSSGPPHASAVGAQLAGNALGMGNPCGSVVGYGNKDAIVVSGGCDRDVRVWDLRTGQCKHVLHGHTSTVRCLKVLDGKPIAVSGSRDSTLRVWNVETGEHVHLLAGHQHSVRCIEVAGDKVASGSYDGTCRVWHLDTGRCLHVLRGHIHYIYAVAFDGKRVATGSLDSTVRVWSAETGDCLALFQGHTSLVGQLQLLDNTLVTGGSDGRVIVFSLNTYECLHRLCAHDNSVTCLQFDDRYIITGGNDGRVKLWDFNTGKFIREICEPCEQVWKVTYRDDKVVVLCKRGEKTCMDVITFRPAADEM